MNDSAFTRQEQASLVMAADRVSMAIAGIDNVFQRARKRLPEGELASDQSLQELEILRNLTDRLLSVYLDLQVVYNKEGTPVTPMADVALNVLASLP